MQLRPYQTQIIDSIRRELVDGNRHILMGAATGAGKSIMLKHIIDGAVSKDKRVTLVAPRRKLIYQLFKTLDRPGAVSVTMGSDGAYDGRLPIQLASSDSLRNRLKKHGKDYLGKMDIILMDEAHIGHNGKTYKLLRELYGDAIWISVSATPIDELGYRLDGYDKTIYDFQTEDLIGLGYLTPVECYAPIKPDLSSVHIQAGDYNIQELESIMDDSAITSNAFEVWNKHASDKKTMIFCVSIAHAETIKKEFESHGIATGIGHSNMDEKEEDTYVADFSSGKIQVLINVMKYTAGYDEPTVECLLLLRPTKSLRLAIQITGRGIRISPETGKDSCLILDCANVIETTGYPTARRNFNREKPPKGKKRKPPEIIEGVSCDNCDHIIDPTKRHKEVNETAESIQTTFRCPFCNSIMSVNVINKREMELQKIEEKQKEMDEKTVYYHKMTNQFGGYKELQKLGRKAGYKNGWAWIQSKAISEHDLWPFAAQVFQRVEGMGLPPTQAISEIHEKIKELQSVS